MPMTRLSQRSQLVLSIAILSLLTYWLASAPSNTFPKFKSEPHFKYPAEAHPKAIAQEQPKRIAIVGAGASGSAAAWFMSRAGLVMKGRVGKEVLEEIIIFEQSDRVGGRTMTVHPHGDESLRAQELGASIFVGANRNMMKAAEHFHLPIIDPDFGDAGIGIWNGKEFVFMTSTSKSYFSNFWDTLAAARRYGPLSPIRTNRAVSALVKKFKYLYNPHFLAKRGVVDSIETFSETVGLGKDLTTRYGLDWAKMLGLSEKWTDEIVGSSTRVNYARGMDQIHALGAGVSMATSGASAILGGNWRIFFSMAAFSMATIWQGTRVTDIVPTGTFDEPKFRVETDSADAKYDDFDAVFFAAPWHLSPIFKAISVNFTEPIPEQPYVHLHVTFVATSKTSPDPGFFGMAVGTKIPNTILTPSSANTTDFNSITWHGETRPGSGEYTVKIFSMQKLDDDFLHRLLGEDPTWILRKEWDSYPELAPIASYAPVEPIKGFHYLGAMEPWISTMETQTISAREAVARAVDDWWGLGMGDCRGGADAWDWTCDE